MGSLIHAKSPASSAQSKTPTWAVTVYLRPEICVLYTSGGDLSGHSEGMVLDGSHFLQKPYGDMQLQASLAFALQAAPVRRPAVATELSISGKELPDDRHNHR